MTDPDLKVVVDDLRATSGKLADLASGFYNDGGGPILRSVTGADSELDATRACGELGDTYLAYAQTLGVGVSDMAGKLHSAAYLYETGDTTAAEAIEFDPPEREELEVGDDPGEPGYDPVNQYEEALQDAGLLSGESSGLYREWLQNAADNGVPPETIVEIARQENLTPQSFDVLNEPGMERVTDGNRTPQTSDDKDYWILPANATPEQARRATLMTYIYNAGTGYGSADGSGDNDFAETPYSAAEVARIHERQADNWWSYEMLPAAMDEGGRFATTPNGMLMGLGGGPLQQGVSAQAGTCVGDVFAVNYDHPTDAATQLRQIIESGSSTYQADSGRPVTGNDLDRVLHHEERHSQQWADRGPLGVDDYLKDYFTAEAWARITKTHNSFEENAGASDGGYH